MVNNNKLRCVQVELYLRVFNTQNIHQNNFPHRVLCPHRVKFFVDFMKLKVTVKKWRTIQFIAQCFLHSAQLEP